MPFARRRKFKRSYGGRKRPTRFKRFRRGIRRIGGKKRRGGFGRRGSIGFRRRRFTGVKKRSVPRGKTRSSGNIGNNYQRISRILETNSTQQFPFSSLPAFGRNSIAWSTVPLAGGIPRGQHITVSSAGVISTPAALAPAVGSVGLDYVLAGYYAVQLTDITPFLGDNFRQFSMYRIRSVTYTFTDTSATAIYGASGLAQGNSIRNAVECMLINTSKSGEFITPLAMADVATSLLSTDNPWYQAENYPSCREIVKKRFIQMGKHQKLQMKITPTEDYVKNTFERDVPTNSSTSDWSANGQSQPQFLWRGQIAAATDDGRAFVVKRRPFRWSQLWLRYYDGSNIVPIMNDVKKAHGVQIMVRNKTYTSENLPYFTVQINVSVEFKGRQQQYVGGNMGTVGAAQSGYMFPFTYAGGNTL